ncbi:MAG: PhoPQ-activated protein PqaA family protein [Gammaproteobacteria bacterium]
MGGLDPYAYRARYTMPTLLLLGTNDPYWTVNSSRHLRQRHPPEPSRGERLSSFISAPCDHAWMEKDVQRFHALLRERQR